MSSTGARVVATGRVLVILIILFHLFSLSLDRVGTPKLSILLHPELKSDSIGDFENRLVELRMNLPKDPVLGYVSDSWDSGRFMKTQYVLAPKLLWPISTLRRPDFRTQERFSRKLKSPVRSIEGLQMVADEGIERPAHVVGVLTHARSIESMEKRFSLEAVHDLGGGLVLFRERD